MSKVKQDGDKRPLGDARSWARTPGSWIAGKASIDGADALAIAMEERWGAGRLRLLVSTELREKFDRQRYLFNQAIWHGDLEAVQREAERMRKAWLALGQAAETAQDMPLAPEVWEVMLDDGTVVAIVKHGEDVAKISPAGRAVVSYTLEEIARILGHYRKITGTKQVFAGATVTAIRSISDPMDGLRDSDVGIDEPIRDMPPGLN
jgi:hypothetical protein